MKPSGTRNEDSRTITCSIVNQVLDKDTTFHCGEYVGKLLETQKIAVAKF